MSITKITIKYSDGQGPAIIQKNQLSSVQHQTRNSLYQQKPQRDRKIDKKSNIKKINQSQEKIRKSQQRTPEEERAYKMAEKKAMEDMDKMSKNQASLGMIQNSNAILQKQNQILEHNQKTVHNMMKNGQNNQKNFNNVGEEVKQVLDQVFKQVDEIKKIRDQIKDAGRQISRTLQDTQKSRPQIQTQVSPNNVTEMNSNLKHLAEISQNQIEGLENLEGIKSLQNFNIEAYSQAINGLKKQIVQYQKQSQNIERQLKLRSNKLQKMDISPNFDEQLLEPYQKNLRKKVDKIDLHSIKQKVYEKLGNYDYCKFEQDVNEVMVNIKNQMSQFSLICQKYRVDAPQIRIDTKQLKGLQFKATSVLDEYKKTRGITYNNPQKVVPAIETDKRNDTGKIPPRNNLQSTANFKKKTRKIPQSIRQLNSKPINYANQVNLLRTGDQKPNTILQNEKKRQKKQTRQKFKKGKNFEEDFEKYLENRANEQLELIYKEKKNKLQRMKNQLVVECNQQPEVYLNLNLKNQIQKGISQEKQQRKEEIKPLPKQEQEKKEKLSESRNRKEQDVIKEIGTEVLKEKLKNLFNKNDNTKKIYQQSRQNFHHQNRNNPPQTEVKVQNIAQNFISMINKTLTQVNNQLSNKIQEKIERRSQSRQRRDYERRSPPKIAIPKLEEFRPPPIFNVALQPQMGYMPQHPPKKVLTEKIQKKDYDRYKFNMDDNDLEISDISSDNIQ